MACLSPPRSRRVKSQSNRKHQSTSQKAEARYDSTPHICVDVAEPPGIVEEVLSQPEEQIAQHGQKQDLVAPAGEPAGVPLGLPGDQGVEVLRQPRGKVQAGRFGLGFERRNRSRRLGQAGLGRVALQHDGRAAKLRRVKAAGRHLAGPLLHLAVAAMFLPGASAFHDAPQGKLGRRPRAIQQRPGGQAAEALVKPQYERKRD